VRSTSNKPHQTLASLRLSETISAVRSTSYNNNTIKPWRLCALARLSAQCEAQATTTTATNLGVFAP